MWRQNAYLGNSDSDQSISDEELNGDLGDKFISLNSNTRKEQGLLLQRLEILGGTTNATSSHEKKKFAFHEDEDVISEEDDYALLNYSITSGARILNRDGNLNSFRSEKQDEACTWSMINKEAEALIHLNENALSKENNFCKGVRGKVKPKFYIHPNSRKDKYSLRFIASDENFELSKVDYVPKELERTEDGSKKSANPEFFEDLNRENEKELNLLPAKEEASRTGLIKHPMAELLNGLQDRNVPLGGNSKMFRRTKGKKAQFVPNKSTSPGEDVIVDNEDQQPELVYTRLSGYNEMKKQTIADRFQDAFAATSFSNDGGLVSASKLSGIGLFGKLQQVMQSEKGRDADFLTKRLMGAGCNDEPHSIVVKILSRYLEAKLIVCQCFVGKHTEGFQLLESSQMLLDRGRRRTVIFNTKVCSDVDLEVGNLICIHPPWKEVEMIDRHESIILSTYFSQVLM
ncbi:uncharacterized protein [Euphorbia lathyris]|uniref:uncharacterized protein isoform X2 n=1 Tax=Euphorbia lathyris TaxID=212925 RepID=UPI0033134D1A